MEQMPKIVITPQADQSLEAMLKDVNEGFTSGRVKKAQLASWIIRHFHEKLFSKQIEVIRADHFDQIAHLEATIKRMKAARDAGQTVELGGLLAPVLQRQKRSPAVGSKRTKKAELASKERIPE